jgi:hypothetical protein
MQTTAPRAPSLVRRIIEWMKASGNADSRSRARAATAAGDGRVGTRTRNVLSGNMAGVV